MKHRGIMALVCTAGLSFFSCQTAGEHSESAEDDGRGKERTGTAVGAVSGAAAGAAIGKGSTRGRNAIIGAVVGGIAGNRIGAYMDDQEEELRSSLEGTGVGVERQGDRIELVMPGDVTFATGESTIESQFQPILADVANVLQKYPKTQIQVKGFTDSTGPEPFNQLLSEQRAESVASYLKAQGIAEVRVETRGFGESQPVAANDTTAGRQQNRRVELELIPVVAE